MILDFKHPLFVFYTIPDKTVIELKTMIKFIIYYYFFLVFLLSIFVSGVIDSQDGFQYLAVARNIYYTHEPTSPPYEFTGGPWNGKNVHMNVSVGKDGKSYSGTGLGYSIAMLPAVFLADMVYKIYNITPPVHFPLESDWFILFAASFTNIFYSAALGVLIFLYLLKLKLSFKQALFISFISIFTTNLFALSKHIYAQIMFTTFLFLSFYLVKEYRDRRRRIFLVLSVLAFGITSTVYNQTFILAIIPLTVYYFLLTKPSSKPHDIKQTLKDITITLGVILPFIVFYFWFENLRASGGGNNVSNPAFFVNYAQYITQPSQLPLIFEGIYGQLLSPGRSIFIYSPILLVILFFWHKMRKQVKPELVVFLLLSGSYILLYSKQIMFETWNSKYISYWHGELSWGPRYLLPLVPFGILVMGHIYQQLKTKSKFFVVGPLLLIGLFIEVLGITIPYQTKLHGLETDVMISGYHYTSFSYINFLPQLTPVYTTAKKMTYLMNSFPKTLDHGVYNVKYYDGIDFPFNVGLERWRTIENQGYISFDNNSQNPVKNISLTLINHPLKESTSSAKVNFYFNQEPISSSNILDLGKRSRIEATLPNLLLKDKDNLLLIDASFESENISKNHTQIIALLEFSINGNPQNIESLDFPYLSDLGPAITQAKYQNYGGKLNNPWQSWMIHTQIFERTPDFWWIKFLYYWDVPKTFFLGLFLINIAGIILFGIKIYQLLKHNNKINTRK